MTSAVLSQCFMESPVGRLRLVAADDGLVGVYFREHRHMRALEAREVADHPVLASACDELRAYFAGGRGAFATPLAPCRARGGTAFQHVVWEALRAIPYGATWSYRELAAFIGNPSAVRAVGAANGRNPLSIFVPCHRVIASSGTLTGYAGGLDRKRWLLAHEAEHRPRGRAPGQGATVSLDVYRSSP